MARKRTRWKAHQGRIDPSRLVFLDETWVKTNMAPLRGWGPRGQRLKAYAPYGHWNTLTFIAALRHDRIDAPCVIDGPINGELFQLYVEKVLAPTLSRGDVVILDNLGSHKTKAARAEGRRRAPDLPAALQSRPQPHRAGLRKAQAPDEKGPDQGCRIHMAKSRTTPRPLHAQRVRKLPRQLRIWIHVNATCSRTHYRPRGSP